MPIFKDSSIEFLHRSQASITCSKTKDYFNKFGVILKDVFCKEGDDTDVYSFSIKGADQVCKALLYMNADGFYGHGSLIPMLKKLMPEVRQKDPTLYNDLIDCLEILLERNQQLFTYKADLESLKRPGAPIVPSWQVHSESTHTNTTPTKDDTINDFESIIKADAERAKRLGFDH